MSDNVEIVKKTQPLKRRQKLAMALLGAVILSSGFVLGASSTFFFLRERIRPSFPPGRFLQSLTKDLQLSPDQQARVEVLLDELHKKFTIVREEVGTKMKGHYDEMVGGMKSILTEEQFATWDADLKSRMERRRQGWNQRREGGRGRRDRPRRGDGPRDQRQRGPGPNQAP